MEPLFVEAEEELIVEAKLKSTTITIKEFAPTGVRLELNIQGEVRGKYNARHIETVSALRKSDGTGEYEGRSIQSTDDGDTILVTLKGKSRQEDATTMRIEGEQSYRTASKELAWLNTVKGRHEGSVNLATGELVVKAYGRK